MHPDHSTMQVHARRMSAGVDGKWLQVSMEPWTPGHAMHALIAARKGASGHLIETMGRPMT